VIAALSVAAGNATIEAAGEVSGSPGAQHASVLIDDVLRPGLQTVVRKAIGSGWDWVGAHWSELSAWVTTHWHEANDWTQGGAAEIWHHITGWLS
jgi:hypothetical protein